VEWRFSVVIPTYERRELALASVSAFARQSFSGRFEVIVVVDGSTDGTAGALRALDVPFPLTVVEQPNRGASAARNAGAAAARGEILLFLDDDMEAHADLLAEHDRSHRDGADVVFGHLPLHPQSPANFLSAGIKWWTDGRLERLTGPGAQLTLHDLLTGQMSISSELFKQAGGFDPGFTAGGTFGDEDIDFGYRLMRAGYRLTFNPAAISWQNYVVRPHQYLRQWRQAGSADVAFARKHPEAASTIFALNGAEKKANRLLWRPLVSLAPVTTPIMAGLRWLALALVRHWSRYPAIVRFFYQVWAMEYWRGVRDGGGMPRPRPVCVLAYHAIQDLGHAPVIGPYTVAPRRFASQLHMLCRLGFNFVTLDEVLCYVRGRGGLPRRPLLLTFDDGYAHLLETMLPVVRARSIPAVAFAVSTQLGGTNVWDEAIGAPSLRLLDADGLRQLAAGGVEIGAHSRTHRPLTKLCDQQLTAEIAGSIKDLEEAGVRRPRAFAYPEGEHDERVVSAARDSGLDAAFTVVPGRLQMGSDPLRIPRVEVLAADGSLRLLWKVLGARVKSFERESQPAGADALAPGLDERPLRDGGNGST